MSSLPIPIDIQAQIVGDFRPVIHRFVLHNARPIECERYFGGTRMTIPPSNGFHPEKFALDSTGKKIPGSFVVEDIYTRIDDQGEEILTFNASRAIAHILGIGRTPSGELTGATSRAALGGLSLLPYTPTPEQVSEVQKAGKERAFLVEVENSRYEIAAFQHKNMLNQKSGLAAELPDERVERAMTIVNEYNKKVRANAFSIDIEDEFKESMAELELDVTIKSLALELAKKAARGKTIDAVELTKSMLADPRIAKQLRRQGISIRERGHMKKTMKELELESLKLDKMGLNVKLPEDEDEIQMPDDGEAADEDQ